MDDSKKRGNPSWVKGGPSPNPSGTTPGIAELRKMHLPYGEEALLTLVDLMREGSEKSRFAAARELLDRILGRTRQDIGGPDGSPVKLDLDVVGLLRKLTEKPE